MSCRWTCYEDERCQNKYLFEWKILKEPTYASINFWPIHEVSMTLSIIIMNFKFYLPNFLNFIQILSRTSLVILSNDWIHVLSFTFWKIYPFDNDKQNISDLVTETIFRETTQPFIIPQIFNQIWLNFQLKQELYLLTFQCFVIPNSDVN